MTVLLVGAIYWVWTQIQYVQRKVNVLENGVYELKTLCQKLQIPDSSESKHSAGALAPVQYPPAPSSVLGEDEDLLHETLHNEEEDQQAPEPESEPLKAMNDDLGDLDDLGNIGEPNFDTEDASAEKQDDLTPGGSASGIQTVSDTPTALDSLPLKELRRLGEQHGIVGVKEMKRKELIAAIRQKPKINFFGMTE